MGCRRGRGGARCAGAPGAPVPRGTPWSCEDPPPKPPRCLLGSPRSLRPHDSALVRSPLPRRHPTPGNRRHCGQPTPPARREMGLAIIALPHRLVPPAQTTRQRSDDNDNSFTGCQPPWIGVAEPSRPSSGRRPRCQGLGEPRASRYQVLRERDFARCQGLGRGARGLAAPRCQRLRRSCLRLTVADDISPPVGDTPPSHATGHRQPLSEVTFTTARVPVEDAPGRCLGPASPTPVSYGPLPCLVVGSESDDRSRDR